MAPTFNSIYNSFKIRETAASHPSWNGSWRDGASTEDFILESWSQGLLVGSLMIMGCVTVANMRKGILLHKLILLEQLLALTHGTFCFMAFQGYGWYLSSTAMLLYCSYFLHNVVAWMKIRPFFAEPRSMFKHSTGKWVTRIYLGTLMLTIPPLILQIVDNFLFFNNINDLYESVRPAEPLMRDPWWVFTCLALFHIIRKCYGTGTFELIKRSPRFGILLAAIVLAMIFTIVDIVASFVHNFAGTDGINPFWKLSLVFKCLTDTIMLDDFKTELKRLGLRRLQKDEQRRQSVAMVLDPDEDMTEAKSDQRELEFSDMLDSGPMPSNQNDGGFRGRKSNVKKSIGRIGEKIRPLPSLNAFRFTAIKGGQKTGKERDTDRDRDEEKAEASSRETSLERVRKMRQSLGVLDYQASNQRPRKDPAAGTEFLTTTGL